jgi:hypothetical protein
MTSVPNDQQAEKRSELVRQGVETVKDSKRFTEYLAFASRFHSYSFNNRMLIWLQRPEASQVAGFQTWKALGRHVKKGEKGIGILAPVAFRKEADGDADEEEAGESVAVGFRVVYVFDLSQATPDRLASLRPVIAEY